jgi:hypothetical protein
MGIDMGPTLKCLVIDADIARAASERDGIDPRPKDCREFLEAVRDTKHRVVRTEAISIEWDKHQSKFTQTWLIDMVKRKQICWIDAPADDQLRRDIERYAIAISEKRRDAMLKDTHLIEAALQADRIVISMDKKIRHYFGQVAHQIQPLALIVWVNPCISEETVIDWLQYGAPLEKERLLGYSRENSME